MLSEEKSKKKEKKDRVPAKVETAEVNQYLMCQLCSGYLIDATAIIECQHTFCKSCILKYIENTSYCPICEVQLNKWKPHLSLRADGTLQRLVYKLVPGLFGSEICRRKEYCAKVGIPEPQTNAILELDEGADLCPLTLEDSVSLSLEYYKGSNEDHEDVKDSGKKSTCSDKVNNNSTSTTITPTTNTTTTIALVNSSAGNPAETVAESKSSGANDRRYLQCPAAVSVGLLKKFIRMKYGLSGDYRVDLMYNGVRDNNLTEKENDLTLLDIAFIFKWKKDEPMCFHYQIFDRPLKSIHLGSKRSAASIMDGEPSEDDEASSGPPRNSQNRSTDSQTPQSKIPRMTDKSNTTSNTHNTTTTNRTSASNDQKESNESSSKSSRLLRSAEKEKRKERRKSRGFKDSVNSIKYDDDSESSSASDLNRGGKNGSLKVSVCTPSLPKAELSPHSPLKISISSAGSIATSPRSSSSEHSHSHSHHKGKHHHHHRHKHHKHKKDHHKDRSEKDHKDRESKERIKLSLNLKHAVSAAGITAGSNSSQNVNQNKISQVKGNTSSSTADSKNSLIIGPFSQTQNKPMPTSGGLTFSIKQQSQSLESDKSRLKAIGTDMKLPGHCNTTITPKTTQNKSPSAALERLQQQQQQQQQQSQQKVPESVQLQVPKSVTLIPVPNPNSVQGGQNKLGKSQQQQMGGRNTHTFTHPITNKSLHQITVTEVPPPVITSSTSSTTMSKSSTLNVPLTVPGDKAPSPRLFNGPGSMEITKIYPNQQQQQQSHVQERSSPLLGAGVPAKIFDGITGKKLRDRKSLDISISTTPPPSAGSGGNTSNVSKNKDFGSKTSNKSSGTSTTTTSKIPTSGANTGKNLNLSLGQHGIFSSLRNLTSSPQQLQQQQQQQQQQHQQPYKHDNKKQMQATIDNFRARKLSTDTKIPGKLSSSVKDTSVFEFNNVRTPSPPPNKVTHSYVTSAANNSGIKRPFESSQENISQERKRDRLHLPSNSSASKVQQKPQNLSTASTTKGSSGRDRDECPLDLSGKSSRNEELPEGKKKLHIPSSTTGKIENSFPQNLSKRPTTPQQLQLQQQQQQQQQHKLNANISTSTSTSISSTASRLNRKKDSSPSNTQNILTIAQNLAQKQQQKQQQQQQQQQINSQQQGKNPYSVASMNPMINSMSASTPQFNSSASSVLGGGGNSGLRNLLTLANASEHLKKLHNPLMGSVGAGLSPHQMSQALGQTSPTSQQQQQATQQQMAALSGIMNFQNFLHQQQVQQQQQQQQQSQKSPNTPISMFGNTPLGPDLSPPLFHNSPYFPGNFLNNPLNPRFSSQQPLRIPNFPPSTMGSSMHNKPKETTTSSSSSSHQLHGKSSSSSSMVKSQKVNGLRNSPNSQHIPRISPKSSSSSVVDSKSSKDIREQPKPSPPKGAIPNSMKISNFLPQSKSSSDKSNDAIITSGLVSSLPPLIVQPPHGSPKNVKNHSKHSPSPPRKLSSPLSPSLLSFHASISPPSSLNILQKSVSGCEKLSPTGSFGHFMPLVGSPPNRTTQLNQSVRHIPNPSLLFNRQQQQPITSPIKETSPAKDNRADLNEKIKSDYTAEKDRTAAGDQVSKCSAEIVVEDKVIKLEAEDTKEDEEEVETIVPDIIDDEEEKEITPEPEPLAKEVEKVQVDTEVESEEKEKVEVIVSQSKSEDLNQKDLVEKDNLVVEGNKVGTPADLGCETSTIYTTDNNKLNEIDNKVVKENKVQNEGQVVEVKETEIVQPERTDNIVVDESATETIVDSEIFEKPEEKMEIEEEVVEKNEILPNSEIEIESSDEVVDVDGEINEIPQPTVDTDPAESMIVDPSVEEEDGKPDPNLTNTDENTTETETDEDDDFVIDSQDQTASQASIVGNEDQNSDAGSLEIETISQDAVEDTVAEIEEVNDNQSESEPGENATVEEMEGIDNTSTTCNELEIEQKVVDLNENSITSASEDPENVEMKDSDLGTTELDLVEPENNSKDSEPHSNCSDDSDVEMKNIDEEKAADNLPTDTDIDQDQNIPTESGNLENVDDPKVEENTENFEPEESQTEENVEFAPEETKIDENVEKFAPEESKGEEKSSDEVQISEPEVEKYTCLDELLNQRDSEVHNADDHPGNKSESTDTLYQSEQSEQEGDYGNMFEIENELKVLLELDEMKYVDENHDQDGASKDTEEEVEKIPENSNDSDDVKLPIPTIVVAQEAEKAAVVEQEHVIESQSLVLVGDVVKSPSEAEAEDYDEEVSNNFLNISSDTSQRSRSPSTSPVDQKKMDNLERVTSTLSKNINNNICSKALPINNSSSATTTNA